MIRFPHLFRRTPIQLLRNNLPQAVGHDDPIYNKLFYYARGQLSEIREGLTPNDTSWQRGAIINF